MRGTIHPLPQFAESVATPEVVRASRLLSEALARLQACRDELAKVQAAYLLVEGADRAAAEAAFEKGLTAPPKAKAPAARAEVESAQRLLDVAEARAQEAEAKLRALLHEHRAEILASVQSERRDVAGEVRELIGRLESRLLRARELAVVRAAVEQLDGSRSESFQPVHPSHRGRDPLPQEWRALLGALYGLVATTDYEVGRDDHRFVVKAEGRQISAFATRDEADQFVSDCETYGETIARERRRSPAPPPAGPFGGDRLAQESAGYIDMPPPALPRG